MLITTHLAKIVPLIAQHQPVTLTLPASSGHLIALPAALAKLGSVCLVVDSKEAALSLTDYQKFIDQAMKSGQLAQSNSPNSVIYLTAEQAQAKMLSYFQAGAVAPIDFTDFLIVNQANSLVANLIVSLWSTAKQSQVKVPRLILIDNRAINSQIEPSPINYQLNWEPAFTQIFASENLVLPCQNLTEKVAQLVEQVHQSHELTDGHLLVFVPNPKVSQALDQQLKTLMQEELQQGTVQIHSASAGWHDLRALRQKNTQAKPYQSKQAKVYQVSRKIIITTTTDLPFEGVAHVIDTLLITQPQGTQQGGWCQRTTWVTKSLAEERASFLIKSGTYYTLATQAQYQELATESSPCLITDHLSLQIMATGLPISQVFPKMEAGQNSDKLARQLGLINGVHLTEKGQFVVKLPLAMRPASFLWAWLKQQLPTLPGLVIAAIIDGHDPFYFNWSDQAEAFQQYAGHDELETVLNVWHQLIDHLAGQIETDQPSLVEWTQAQHLNLVKIVELLQLIEQLLNILPSLGYTVQVAPFTTAGAIKAAKPLLRATYYDQILLQQGKYYLHPLTRQAYRLNYRQTVSRLVINQPPAILPLITQRLASGHCLLVTLAIETEPINQGKYSKKLRQKVNQPPKISQTTRQREYINYDLLKGSSMPCLNVEYGRYACVQKMLVNFSEKLAEQPKALYEATNALERWLINLANDQTELATDPIFSLAKLTPDYWANEKFRSELSEKQVETSLVTDCLQTVSDWLSHSGDPGVPAPRLSHNQLVLENYRSHYSAARLKLLLSKGSLTEVALMSLRYGSLLPKGQQWNLPLALFEILVKKYQFNLEGFASPINSQMLNFNLPFCSLFSETDRVFGSCGSFFDQTLNNQRVFANPPFTLSVMNRMADFVVSSLRRADQLLLVINVPSWTDAPFYQQLSQSEFTKAVVTFAPKEFFYYDGQQKKVVANFPATFFILRKGYEEVLTEELVGEIRQVFQA